MLEINPLNIPPAYAACVASLLSQSTLHYVSQTTTFHDAQVGAFHFSYALIKWQHAIFEIFDERHMLAKGGQAKVHLSHGSLHVTADGIFVTRERPYVIKVGPIENFSQVEKSLYSLNASLHCRPIVVIENVAFLIMEKAPGTTLTHFLADREPLLTVVQRLALSFAILDECIHLLDEMKVSHGDIKPDNIMVSLRGNFPIVRMVDYGVAQFLNAPTLAKEIFQGTPMYAPPEYYKSQIVHEQSDTFSVAMVLALIWGAVLKRPLPGVGVFVQSIEYGQHMDYDRALYVDNTPRRAMADLEKMLTRMSHVDLRRRIGVREARAWLVEFSIHMDAKFYENTAPLSADRNPLCRLESCWVQRFSPTERQHATERKPIKYSLSALSLVSDESSKKSNATPETEENPMQERLHSSFLFFEQSPLVSGGKTSFKPDR